MTLFEVDPQFREKATLWRIFATLPLFGPLANGEVFRWFAVNIPMDLGTGGEFTSDVDVLARVWNRNRNAWTHHAYEAKVSLLCADGTARSLKQGKHERLLKQLLAYRKFGIPTVTLLDIYLCESGHLSKFGFPSAVLKDTILAKIRLLKNQGFGYRLLPIEYTTKDGMDFQLVTLADRWFKTGFDVLPPSLNREIHPFSNWVASLSDFFEAAPDRPRKNFCQIVYCRLCRHLKLINMQEEDCCPSCKDELITQS